MLALESALPRTGHMASSLQLIQAQEQTVNQEVDHRPPCRNFIGSGFCKFGDRCHFSHQDPNKKQ